MVGENIIVNNTCNGVNLFCANKIVSIFEILLNDHQKINLATMMSILHN